MDIGSRIKKFREKVKLSQEELADRVFVSRQTISNWETNKNYLDIKSLSLLSNIFDVSLDDLIEGDIEEMENEIDDTSIKKLNKLSTIFTIELMIMIGSAYPLAKFLDVIGIIIWAVIFVITFITSLYVEKFKKDKKIQTYKEILSFMNGKHLTKDEKNQEIGKRPYQRVLLIIGSGVIAFIVLILMECLLG